MAVLVLDTSAYVDVAVLADDGEPLARRVVDAQRRHAETLAVLVRDLLAEVDVATDELTAVAVGTGPAPFTGLRVGLVTARTIAFARCIPVYGVSSLDALAASSTHLSGFAADRPVLAALDAKRREIYWARYRVTPGEPVPSVEVLEGPAVGAPGEVDVAGALVVGSGAKGRDDIEMATGAPLVPDPFVLGRLALARRAAGLDQPTEPLYLRRPDVQPPGARKRVSGPIATSPMGRP